MKQSNKHNGRSDEVKKRSVWGLCQRHGLHVRQFSLLITSENHQVKVVWENDHSLP